MSLALILLLITLGAIIVLALAPRLRGSADLTALGLVAVCFTLLVAANVL